jgi:hypothetical protein
MDGLDDTNATKGAISDEQQPSVESLARRIRDDQRLFRPIW